jgi:hypothetical protein
MFEALWHQENIVHVGAALYLAGFLFRDQLMLRGLIIAGDLVYILYFMLAPEVPLWGGVFWSAVFMIVNTWMIARIIADRTHLRLSDDDQRLFRLLDGLSPGEFRRLMKIGTWHRADGPTVLTNEGQSLGRLYYVLDGAITIDKAGHSFAIAPETFIGEVAFLTGRTASATVTVGDNATYVSWDRAALRRLQMRAPSLTIALHGVLNKDMAAKVAKA